MFEPAYLSALKEGSLQEKIDQASRKALGMQYLPSKLQS